jgi:endonuclease YncB( thermonuclease family)
MTLPTLKKLVPWALGIFFGLAALGGLLELTGLAPEEKEDECFDAAEVGSSCDIVTEVIDGDTVEMGLGRVRLIGVDAPEEGRCFDNAATRFTRARLLNEIVHYELGEEDKDQYGRTLAYLSLNGEMHNLALVVNGYARAETIRPNDKYASRFEAGQEAARKQGLWLACPTGPSAPDIFAGEELGRDRERLRAGRERDLDRERPPAPSQNGGDPDVPNPANLWSR